MPANPPSYPTLNVTDFSEYTTGLAPSDWDITEAGGGDFTVAADGTFTGGKKLVKTVGSTRSTILYDAPAYTQDRQEVLVRLKIGNAASGANDSVIVVLRSADDPAAQSLYCSVNLDTNQINIGADLISSSVASLTGKNLTNSIFIWIRLWHEQDQAGNNAWAKVWRDVDPEPALHDVLFRSTQTTGKAGIISSWPELPEYDIFNHSELFPIIGPPDVTRATIVADPTIIDADGVSTSLITVQSVNFLGENINIGGLTVVINTDFGSIGATTDVGDGTYTATLTSAVTPGLATLGATISAVPITATATVQMTEIPDNGIVPLNIVRKESDAVGGAIDPEAELRNWVPFTDAEQISFVSDKADDNRSMIVRGFGTDGEEVAEQVKLQGTTTVTTARFFKKLFMIQASQASDTLANNDPAINAVVTITSTTIADTLTQGRARLTNMLAYTHPMDFGTIVRYEKLYFFNNTGSTVSLGAALTIVDNADATLEWGLDLAKNDPTEVSGRSTAPAGVVFDTVPTTTPADLLINEYHGLWIKQTLTTRQLLANQTFQFTTPVETFTIGMEPLDRSYDQIVAL